MALNPSNSSNLEQLALKGLKLVTVEYRTTPLYERLFINRQPCG